MASPLKRLIQKLVSQYKRRAAQNKADDEALADSGTVGEVYRPTSDQPISSAPGEEHAESFFGPSGSELDRDPNVIYDLQQTIRDNPNVRLSGTIEQQLDDVQRELIDEGILTDLTRRDTNIIKDPKGAEEQALRRARANAPKKSKERKTYPGDNRPPEGSEASRVIELEEIEEAMKSGKGRKVPPGTAKGLQDPKTARRSDDIDVIGEKRDARIRDIDKQLQSQRNPEMRQSPAIREALIEDIVEADVADLAAGQAFGRSTSKRKFDPSKTTADREIDNFGLRQLEDIYGVNQTGTEAERAVKALRKETGDASRDSLRLPEPNARVAVPPDVNAFMMRKRPDASKLEAVQEKLTGPLNEQTKQRLLLEELRNREKTANLRQKRLRKEDLPVKELYPYGSKSGAIKVRDVDSIVSSKGRAGPQEISARIDRQTNTVLLNPKQIEIDFNNKQWTNPRVAGVKPLPEDAFKTPNEYRQFLIEHEKAHADYPKRSGESHIDLENRINQIAMERIIFAKPPTGGMAVE
tara:strand:- start:5928 stop:7499 length:1572 start_codon:yes stop_codon:yes gene_type:complete